MRRGPNSVEAGRAWWLELLSDETRRKHLARRKTDDELGGDNAPDRTGPAEPLDHVGDKNHG